MNPHYIFVSDRALHRCEYRRAPEEGFNFHFEVEHIIPRSRGGSDEEDNLALACTACNLFKWYYLAAYDEVTQSDVPTSKTCSWLTAVASSRAAASTRR